MKKTSIRLALAAGSLLLAGASLAQNAAPNDQLYKAFGEKPGLVALMDDFMKRGGTIWACPPCVKSRGYEQADLMDGVIVIGASAMHAEIKAGAATLSF